MIVDAKPPKYVKTLVTLKDGNSYVVIASYPLPTNKTDNLTLWVDENTSLTCSMTNVASFEIKY